MRILWHGMGSFFGKKINIHIIVDKASNVKNCYYYLDDCFELTKSNKKIAVAKDFKKIKIFMLIFITELSTASINLHIKQFYILLKTFRKNEVSRHPHLSNSLDQSVALNVLDN